MIRCARAATCRSCVIRMTVVAGRREVGKQRHDFRAARGIERTGGLVGEQDVPAIHQRAADRDALLLPARQLVRPVIEPRGETKAREQGRRARVALGPHPTPE